MVNKFKKRTNAFAPNHAHVFANGYANASANNCSSAFVYGRANVPVNSSFTSGSRAKSLSLLH